MKNLPTKIGIEFVFSGDHHVHRIGIKDDVHVEWDDTSIVLTMHLNQRDAEEIYWRLLGIIPQLQDDQR